MMMRKDSRFVTLRGNIASLSGGSLRANGGGLFLVATGIANLASFGFHLATSRLLGPAGYGTLGSLLGLVTAAALPSSAVQAAIGRRVALHQGQDQASTSPISAPPPAILRGALAGLACGLAVALLTPLVDDFLNLADPVPALLLAITVGLTVASIAPGGVLLGALRFRALALALTLGALSRLAFGSLLVGLGYRLTGATAGSMLGAAVSLACLLWPFRPRRVAGTVPATEATPSSASAVPGAERDQWAVVGPTLLAIAALAGVSTFLGVDTALARHFLGPRAAGDYAAAATIARVGLFLPGSIALAVFPRLAATQRVEDQRRLLREALGLTALVAGAAATVLALEPRLLTGAFFGQAYRGAAGPLVVLASAGVAVGLGSVLVYFFLSRHSPLALSWWAALGTLVVLVFFAHRGPLLIAWETVCVSGATTVLLLLSSMRAVRPRRGAATRQDLQSVQHAPLTPREDRSARLSFESDSPLPEETGQVLGEV
jgi:O-antigen/teichoic acid export membrane protein